MQVTAQAMPVSNRARWTGYIFSALVSIFLLIDGGMKLFNPPPVAETQAALGVPDSKTFALGVLLLICTVIYLIPRTSVLGAILLTGYLGGATAIQMRVDAPVFSLIFPALLGLLVWGGLYLRDLRLRGLIPLVE